MQTYTHSQDSIPRGAIRLHPGAWVKPIAQGTARQSDAVAKTPPNAIISVVRSGSKPSALRFNIVYVAFVFVFVLGIYHF